MPDPSPALPPLDPPEPAPPGLIPFVKAHANGNDFLILDESVAAGRHHASLARRLCARSTGIGADGIEFLHRRPDGTLFLRLFNADGSEAELSGNGTRCVAAWLAATQSLTEITLHTHGGPRPCQIVEARDPHFLIRTAMGIPRVVTRTLDLPATAHGPALQVPGAMVNVGNPHFVLFVETPGLSVLDFSAHNLPWQTLGERIATSPLFPHGTNVEFVRILSPTEIAFRIFERGCGPTASSGTGTCASATAAIALRNTARTLTAHAEGGPQQVEWPTPESPMHLIGPAVIICRGEAASR